MTNIVERLRSKVVETEAPPVTQVFDTQPQTQEVAPVRINVQPVVEPKVIKQNKPGVPLMGFTLETLANELGVVLEKAMHKAGINSINADAFGLFAELNIVPKGFTLTTDEFTGMQFYVLENTNRMTEIFKSLVKALNSSSSEVISFPYLVTNTLELPLKYVPQNEEFEDKTLKVISLYLTAGEINNLNYKFISEIHFCQRSESVPDSIDLLSLKIDREEWKAAPYRI